MSSAREKILRRLRANQRHLAVPPVTPAPADSWSREQRIAHFIERQQAVHGEVHRLPAAHWMNWLALELPKRGLQRMLAGTGEIGQQLAKLNIRGTGLALYDKPIEDWKPTLFHEVDVAITSTRCGIAETGSLVLWPDHDEPRLMSLVPPVHIALLQADKLHQTFAGMLNTEQWQLGMPSNALLISGPSKTADIEQTLAYGIHGPRELITLILE